MDKIKELVDINLFISFIISFLFLSFIYIGTSFSLVEYKDSTEDAKKLVKNLQTPYKLLYIVFNEDQKPEPELVAEVPVNSLKEFDGIPIPSNVKEMYIENFCNFGPVSKKFSYVQLPRFNYYEISYDPELYRTFKTKIFKQRVSKVPFIYDFVSKQRTELDCSGSYPVEREAMLEVSPDRNIILFGDDIRSQKEYTILGKNFNEYGSLNYTEGVRKKMFIFPYFGEKNNLINSLNPDNDQTYFYSKILLNGVVVIAKNEGIVLNPFIEYTPNKSPLYNVSILGWIK